MMRWLFVALAVLFNSAEATASTRPEPGDGERIEFDVFREGDTRFGTHEVVFERDGEDILASISIRLRAGLGPITVFRYEHDSTERWRDAQLVGMRGRTLKDGETYDVEVSLTPEGLAVVGREPEGAIFETLASPDLLSSSHWRGYPQDMESMLNTEHGTLMDTVVEYLGQTEIEGDGGMIEVDHYRLRSSLTVDLYYDQNGRWAGCAFDARGQAVRYVRRFDPVAG